MEEMRYKFTTQVTHRYTYNEWDFSYEDIEISKVLLTPSSKLNSTIHRTYQLKIVHDPLNTVNVYFTSDTSITTFEKITIFCKGYAPSLFFEHSDVWSKGTIRIGSFRIKETCKSIKIHCTIDHALVHVKCNMRESVSNIKKETIAECKENLDPKIILFTDSEFTDITFCIGNAKFKAHKAILAAHSPVFRAMFMHNLRERNESIVYIIDMSPKAFSSMLQYIYMGTITDIEDVIFDVTIVADKYAVDTLLEYCIVHMSKHIKCENCILTYVTAYMIQCNTLKDDVIDFIQGHVQEVKETENFEVALKLHKDIMMELMFRIL